ncbi:MAG TPA: hypothetical protein VFU14_16685 [Acidimicrobiales bacterium]|nr:hypothetical protein [Acidimicrobiales bacterium]
MAPDAPNAADGRRARRERNRVAVIDAMFALLEERHVPPTVEQVAARAEVSVSSVFRYFDSLDDLQEQTIARYFERFAPLFEVPAVEGDRAARIAALVDSRLRLYERIAPLAQVARVRAAEQPRFSRTLLETRRRMAGQVREHLAPDLAHLGRAEADDRVALVDCLTAFEAWDLLARTHGRSRRLIRRAWTYGIEAVLAGPGA